MHELDRLDVDAGDILEECPVNDIEELINESYTFLGDSERWDRVFEWLDRAGKWQKTLREISLREVKLSNRATNQKLRMLEED